MKARNLLIFALVVAALGAFLWFVERDLPSTEERAERAKRVFGGLEPLEIEGVTLEWEDRKVVLVREETPEKQAWRLVEPSPASADAFQVEALLAALTGLEKQRTLEEIDRTEAGLDKPRARIILETGGESLELEVGAEIPASRATVAALAGLPGAFVVDSGFLLKATRDPASWEEKAPSTPQGSESQVEDAAEGAL